jgi:hypothetical protein
MIALKFSLWALTLGSLFATTAVAQADPYPLTGDIKSVHDPTICKDKSGTHYLFCECDLWRRDDGDRYSERLISATGPGVPIRTSTDRKHWVKAGQVFPNGANWTDPYTGPDKYDQLASVKEALIMADPNSQTPLGSRLLLHWQRVFGELSVSRVVCLVSWRIAILLCLHDQFSELCHFPGKIHLR